MILLLQTASQILVLAPVKWQTAQKAADTPHLTGINFHTFTIKRFKEVKFDVTTFWGGEPSSSLQEQKRSGTKVAEEYCWAVSEVRRGVRSCSLPDDGTQGVPKHLVGDFVYLMCLYSSEREVSLVCSGSSVLHFGFQSAFLVHVHLTEHTDMQFRFAQKFDLRRTFQNVVIV